MFVFSRVAEIQRLTSPDEWLHVAGKANIADVATSGTAASYLVENGGWWCGPSWLVDLEQQRPVSRLQSTGNERESIVHELRIVAVPVVTATPLVDLNRVGGWEKAVRVMANVLWFVQRCRKLRPPSDAVRRAMAESHIIKSVQQRHFATEFAAVRTGDDFPRSSKLNAFRLFIDNAGLLRARTRLTQCPQFTFDERNLVVVPYSSRLATLLVLHHHRINAHLGVNAVLNALRRRYWVLRGRQVVKKLLRGCVVCCRTHGRPPDQVQAPLPIERASLVAPFTTVDAVVANTLVCDSCRPRTTD